MSILDEMAQDWVKRLCTAHAAYSKQLDLLLVEFDRMSDADREAVKTAMGGEGFVVALGGLPSATLRKCGLPATTQSSFALNVGGPLSAQATARVLDQLPVEAAADLMGLFGQKVYATLAPAKDHPITFASGEVVFVACPRRVIDDGVQNRLEEAVLAARKGQC
jgi:hypothetical protein